MESTCHYCAVNPIQEGYKYCCKDCTYTCAGCNQVTPYESGAADDMPDHCDKCWADAHRGEKIMRMNTPETDHQIVMVDLADERGNMSQDMTALVNTALALGAAKELERVLRIVDELFPEDLATQFRTILVGDFFKEDGVPNATTPEE